MKVQRHTTSCSFCTNRAAHPARDSQMELTSALILCGLTSVHYFPSHGSTYGLMVHCPRVAELSKLRQHARVHQEGLFGRDFAENAHIIGRQRVGNLVSLIAFLPLLGVLRTTTSPRLSDFLQAPQRHLDRSNCHLATRDNRKHIDKSHYGLASHPRLEHSEKAHPRTPNTHSYCVWLV